MRHHPSNIRPGYCLLVSLACLVFWTEVGYGWGPHPDITRAGMQALPTDAAIVLRLGAEMAKLPDYSWMPDMRRTLRREQSGWFYTDDYLLFPALPKHCDHLCPAVKATYAPHFQRALQALRTENAANAARWIGSLVHFVEDTGAPPHAAGISGVLHGKLENWVDARAIHIKEYRPQVLGQNDAAALAGLCQRLDQLIEFSKQRAERAKPLAIRGERAAVEPILLESALESSRVVADLLLTLGNLAADGPVADKATFRGKIQNQAGSGLEKFSAKVMLLGTGFSTLADAEGRFEFQQLPAGTYQYAVLRPGHAVNRGIVILAAGQEIVKDIQLSADAMPGNMIRNADLGMRWVSPDRPEAWYPAMSRTTPKQPCWEGEVFPLQKGATYRLQVGWQEGAAGRVGIRLSGPSGKEVPPVELPPLGPSQTQLDFTATPTTTQAQVVIYCTGSPDRTCKHVAVWSGGKEGGR